MTIDSPKRMVFPQPQEVVATRAEHLRPGDYFSVANAPYLSVYRVINARGWESCFMGVGFNPTQHVMVIDESDHRLTYVNKCWTIYPLGAHTEITP